MAQGQLERNPRNSQVWRQLFLDELSWSVPWSPPRNHTICEVRHGHPRVCTQRKRAALKDEERVFFVHAPANEWLPVGVKLRGESAREFRYDAPLPAHPLQERRGFALLCGWLSEFFRLDVRESLDRLTEWHIEYEPCLMFVGHSAMSTLYGSLLLHCVRRRSNLSCVVSPQVLYLYAHSFLG